MTDVVDKSTRSRMMAGIRGKDTQPELRVRSALHAAGYRFRLHYRGLPGRPDLVLRKHRTVVFVHGCFWHQHPNCKAATMPGSNAAFWREKLARNVTRDERAISALRASGWRVATIWECAIRQLDDASIVAAFGEWIESGEGSFELPTGLPQQRGKPES